MYYTPQVLEVERVFNICGDRQFSRPVPLFPFLFILPPVLPLFPPSPTGQRVCYGDFVSTDSETKGQIQTTLANK